LVEKVALELPATSGRYKVILGVFTLSLLLVAGVAYLYLSGGGVEVLSVVREASSEVSLSESRRVASSSSSSVGSGSVTSGSIPSNPRVRWLENHFAESFPDFKGFSTKK
jgi:hypothetical protein